MGDAANILGGKPWRVLQGDAIEFPNSLPPDCVDLTFGSPPYMDARTYGIGAQRDCLEWVEWMLKVTEAAARITRGPVFWVAAGVTRDRNYWPGCEGLMWEWWKRGGSCQLYRPCCWLKTDNDDGGTGIPGSGGDDYLRADWEYVMCFKRPGKLAWSDNTAMGHEPIYEEVGGEMSNRTAEGRRINDAAASGGIARKGRRNACGPNRRANGKHKASERTKDMYTRNPDGVRDNDRGESYTPPKIANPGNVVRARVGGGHMGSRLCHEVEAPFPEALAEFFILTFAAPGGVVYDPFCGSGTTLAVAHRHGRLAIGTDLRQSQVGLTLRRLREETPLELFNAQEAP